MELPFQLDVCGKSVLGIIHMPLQNAVGNPVAIMIYGFNGERVDNNRLSVLCGRIAEKKGVIFIRFDYRGLGVSEGEFYNTTLETKIEDTQNIIKFVNKLTNYQASIFLIGFSDGVRVATNFWESEEVSGMCLWSPVLFPIVDEVHGKMPKKFSREPQSKQLVVPHRGLWVGQKYLRQISMPDDSYNRIINVNKPLLTIFGENDPSVIQTKVELENLATNGSSNIDISTIPSADHLYSQEKWTQQISNQTIDWILSKSR